MKKVIPFVALFALVGCGQETVPEPNAATCAPDVFKQVMNELKNEVNRQAFTEACSSFEKARQMRSWQFKSSSPDRY
ncbi:entry exclusion lipoprotein TrbK [Oceanisphaera sp. KMM 10153]|uniref:entry exclusion lipoprotein TrbK n=1 Tax=Oceanisphaera submarina TaxID=3390193 RepID=UPI00397519B7